MQIQKTSSYQQALESIRLLSPAEQLALISDIVAELRESYEEEERIEAEILAESPTFHRLIEVGLRQVEAGQVRPVEDLLDEL